MGCDFEVEILPGVEGEYRVNVVASPAGETSGRLRLDAASLNARRSELQSTVLASAVASRTDTALVKAPVRTIGDTLFSALFTGHVYGRYEASRAAACERGEELRVILRIQTPELATLPWETMFDPEEGSYICQAQPLLRYMSVPSVTHPLRIDPPLRILGMAASPDDLPPLDVAEEQRRLSEVLDGLGDQVELVWADGGTWRDLQQKLLAGPWHIVHFIGHGGFRAGSGVLALVGARGGAEHVTAGRFTTLLSTATPQPRLIVLNSCSSGETGAEDLFAGTAASLVRSGVQAAVAMQFAISDRAASAFAGGFYAAVAGNRSISEAVRIGRIAIVGESAETLEWVTPVLYLRGEDAPLFTVNRPAFEAAVPSPQETAHAAAVQGNYIQALAELRHHDYDAAVTLLDSVLALDPDYRDAAERRDQARAALRARSEFERGEAAERREDWDTAVRSYAAAIEHDPDHPYATERRDTCARRRRVADLEAELRLYKREGNRKAALDVTTELKELRAREPAKAPPPRPPTAWGQWLRGRPGKRLIAAVLVLATALALLLAVTEVRRHQAYQRLMGYVDRTPYAATCGKGRSNEAAGILAQANCTASEYPIRFRLFDTIKAMNADAKANARPGQCRASRPPQPNRPGMWQTHTGTLSGILSCRMVTRTGRSSVYEFCATSDLYRVAFCLYSEPNPSYQTRLAMAHRINLVLDNLQGIRPKGG